MGTGGFHVLDIALLLLILVFTAGAMVYLESYLLSRPAVYRSAVRHKQVSMKVRRMAWTYPDRVRFFTFWLQAERLKRMKIPGAFAEVGVYKGESARMMHHMDPGRKLHLFDTFSGFSSSDLMNETGQASTYSEVNFSDTTIQKALRRIGGNEQVTVHAGEFNDTAHEVENERFALVSIDTDLYNPTKTALEFFYPRLIPSGVILVHDYNDKWTGVMLAVDEFVSRIPERPVFIADREGTVVIVKG
jgi:O-methyltransferase